MTWVIIIIAGGAMLLLALGAAYVLGWANKAFHVAVDPRIEAVSGVLPGANCGGCGCVGCGEFALAVVEGKLSPTKCTVGGASCAAAIAAILGVDAEPTWPYRPIVHCGATLDDRLQKTEYRGEPTCAAANIVSGVQGCVYGCLGIGDCQRSCGFDAIHVRDGLATVDYAKCTGCGACEKACPRHIITMVPFKSEQMLAVTCSNKDFGKDVKAVCKVGCIGCGACARITSMLSMRDNLPSMDYGKYQPGHDELAASASKCPMKRLLMIGRPSERDLAAVATEDLPAIAQPDFKTEVDKTEWHG